MFLEGLPDSALSILCGLAPPCLEDISGVARQVLEGVILQRSSRRLDEGCEGLGTVCPSSVPSLSLP
jgi:hypothetical protein